MMFKKLLITITTVILYVNAKNGADDSGSTQVTDDSWKFWDDSMFMNNSTNKVNETKTRVDDTFSTPTLDSFPTDYVTGDDTSAAIKNAQNYMSLIAMLMLFN